MQTIDDLNSQIAKMIEERRREIITLKDRVNLLEKEITALEIRLNGGVALCNTTLSPREMQVINLVSKGATNLAIASELHLSVTTVKAHMRSIISKLNVKNRAAAVAALSNKLS